MTKTIENNIWRTLSNLGSSASADKSQGTEVKSTGLLARLNLCAENITHTQIDQIEPPIVYNGKSDRAS